MPITFCVAIAQAIHIAQCNAKRCPPFRCNPTYPYTKAKLLLLKNMTLRNKINNTLLT